jgi:penicillin-insensitive murein endopeptidase
MLPRNRHGSLALALVACSLLAVGALADMPHPVTDEELAREAAHAAGHGEPTEAEQRVIDEEIAREEAAEDRAASTPPAPPAPPPGTVAAIVGHSRSVSMGRSNGGLLRNGVPVPTDPALLVKSESRGEHYGTAELVTLLVYGAHAVARSAPGSRLVVGDLSREGGGRLRPHRSHRSGRDVDIGFYMVDPQGRALPAAPGFVHMTAQLVGPHGGRLYGFDVARNWTLVEALLSHPEVHPQYLFVANPLIQALLRHARNQRASAEIIARAEAVLDQPRGSPHRSHFHMRIFCARDDVPSCEDEPPYFPWVPRTP